jgi:hypothetical protein
MTSNLNIKQSPIYGNISVLSPDGTLLFKCLPKKANWYLDRNLAKVINNDPMSIQLTFEPKGKGQSDDPYYLETKYNKCVVCGSEDDLTRHHIVPYTYRKHFPEKLKSHNSYDVVPICVQHHSEYEENYAIELKCVFAERYNAPLEIETKLNSDLTIVVRYSNVLTNNWEKLPYNRKKQMISTIRKYHGDFGRLKQILLMYAYVDLSTTKTETHGQIVANNLINENKLQWFVETWREHFIHSMNPNFMPGYWNINKPIERTE